MNTHDNLLDKIKTQPESIEFQQVIDVIEQHYQYSPERFTNGPADDCVINEKQENEGSCKIFSFAQLQQLDEIQTLNCFGNYYRNDVLKHPDKNDHANIRTFIKYGWQHVKFDNQAIQIK